MGSVVLQPPPGKCLALTLEGRIDEPTKSAS
ncbi:hypothetical protein BKA18_006822 [Streptomyces auratus]